MSSSRFGSGAVVLFGAGLALAVACSSSSTPPAQEAGGAGSGGASGDSSGAGHSAGGQSGASPGAGSGGEPVSSGAAGCAGADCGVASDPGESGAGGAGGETTQPPALVCTPSQPTCQADVATKCNADGSGYEAGNKCSSAQTCVGGECVAHECSPNESFCLTGAVRKCAADGLSSMQVELCGASKYCDVATISCKPGVCAPDQPACNGNTGTTCNATGSGYLGGGNACGTTKTCDAGACADHVCTPSADFCQSGSVRNCAANGLSSTVKVACTATQYCKASTATCVPQVCTPNAATCSGNVSNQCNADGSASTGTACSGATPICIGAGKCVACTPGAVRCTGQQPEKCSAAGAWAKNGAVCAGAELCDVAGNSMCTKSPTVPGGAFNRQNNSNLPATIATFRLDRQETTVGQFRAFVTAELGGWRPTAGSGKHTHLNAGAGLNITSGGNEGGYQQSWVTAANFPATAGAWDTSLACHASLATWTPTAGTNEGRPINCISWYTAYAYCIWSGGFLPSESESSYAAAGGDAQRAYPWGSTTPSPTDALLADWNCHYGSATTCGGTSVIAPVGSIIAGDARWGHSDMAGNMGEWAFDFGSSPTCSNCAAPVGGTSSGVMGGTFATTSLGFISTSFPMTAPEDLTNPTIGVRCARVP